MSEIINPLEAPRALVTGVTGQTGSYLAEFLLEKGYAVYGMKRRTSTQGNQNIQDLLLKTNFFLVNGDMSDAGSLARAITESEPREIYNLAAMSFVGMSWEQPMLTNDVNFVGLMRLLEAVRQINPTIRVYQASSSEMYGNQPVPQSEETAMTPRSPYGVSKLAAHRIARVYRESYGIFISCGICFNHESPRRGPEFVSRKIAMAIAAIAENRPMPFKLGNMKAARDWGFAPDYARAMWMMLQQREPDDFVIATGETHTVEEFVVEAFEAAGLKDAWQSWVETDPALVRPAELFQLRGDARKARVLLGWEPTVTFGKLVKMMVQAEREKLRA